MKNLKEKFLILIFIILSIIIWWYLMSIYFNRKEVSGTTTIVYPQPPNEIGHEDLIIDTSTNRQIVSNLLNIALKDKKGSILEFIADFNKKYNSQYTITSFDTIINKTQIKLESNEERLTLKQKIKNDFPNYDLLIWDESIFQSNVTFKDPAINDPQVNWYYKTLNIQSLWNSYSTSNIIVAVIDNGFDLNHFELKNKFIYPYNVTSKDSLNMSNSVNHGTHVASLVAAETNNQGMVGMAPFARVIPIKIENSNGYMTSSSIIDGVLYAIHKGADVINMSLGARTPLQLSEAQQEDIIKNHGGDEQVFWDELFKYATDNNVICVQAAGNDAVLTGLDPFARSSNSIKVGAYNSSMKITNFSNYGNLTTIFAPGEDILGASPNNQFESMQGTSMASPIVAGIMAILKSRDKNLTLTQAIDFLNQNSITTNNNKLLKIK